MRSVGVASFSGSHKVNFKDSKEVASTAHCAGVNWFIIQSIFFSLYISVLADNWVSRCVYFLLLKISYYAFGLSVSFPAAISSFV